MTIEEIKEVFIRSPEGDEIYLCYCDSEDKLTISNMKKVLGIKANIATRYLKGNIFWVAYNGYYGYDNIETMMEDDDIPRENFIKVTTSDDTIVALIKGLD